MTNTTKLIVEHGGHSRIARFLGVDRGTVIRALAGDSITDKARMIRRIAIEKFGAYEIVPIAKTEVKHL